MSQDIKAIETVYNNYRFRSRLEARWAVFFDELKVEYQYEIEGFDLHYSGWYLPDFYLPAYQTYIEIKPLPNNPLYQIPEAIHFDREAAQKAMELAWTTKKWAILVFGEPLVHRACWFDERGYLEFPNAAIEFEAKMLTPTCYEGQKLKEYCSQCRIATDESTPMQYEHREAGIIARQARFGKNGRG